MPPLPSLPPIRACIFDVDGTLINSEDIYTEIYNAILSSHSIETPSYPWRIKALQQSRGTKGTQRLLDWAQLPLTPAQWRDQEKPYAHMFEHSKLLPGVETLLSDLLESRAAAASPRIYLSLASSAGAEKFARKTAHIPAIRAAFADTRLHVFGDDAEMSDAAKKPCPDIFLLALRRINEVAGSGCGSEGGVGAAITPGECLVFEDSIAGVEAARRAGMRVVWVPHPGLKEVCAGWEGDVLAGMTEEGGRIPDFGVGRGSEEGRRVVKGDDGRWVSEDGFAEMRESLEGFDWGAYGVRIVGQAFTR